MQTDDMIDISNKYLHYKLCFNLFTHQVQELKYLYYLTFRNTQNSFAFSGEIYFPRISFGIKDHS